MTLPPKAASGNYSVRAILESDKPKPKKPEDAAARGRARARTSTTTSSTRKRSTASFLVAAYRRPGLPRGRDADGGVANGRRQRQRRGLRALPVRRADAGAPGDLDVDADAGRSARRRRSQDALPDGDRWTFVGWCERRARCDRAVVSRRSRRRRAPASSRSTCDEADAGVPYVYTLEADVEDVSRQHIANRASVIVHPAPWYVGVRQPATSSSRRPARRPRSSPSSPTGQVVPGVPVDVKLTQVQWNSVRRAEGNGFYTWETERKEVPAGTWTVTTRGQAGAAARAAAERRLLRARGDGARRGGTLRGHAGRRSTRSARGYTAWERYDHNRIDLVADKPRLQARRHRAHHDPVAVGAGDRARHDRARGHPHPPQFALTSTQQSISIPIDRGGHPERVRLGAAGQGTQRGGAPAVTDAPKGGPYAVEDPSDPGKPAFRLGYVELKVEDRDRSG